ncbi:MAG: P1 family peptidase [bacterium]|nr:P1 family peptidase [candidate division KSB1 bacterium]MDH7559547.1 P1 family peptidase [bacterium]
MQGVEALAYSAAQQERPRARDVGVCIGLLPPGKWNAITDVEGVRVGHYTLVEGDSVRTGVTVILPHAGNLFMERVPAAVSVGNAFGKLTGFTQVEELGELETPIALVNTLSVPVAATALIDYTLRMPGNQNVRSVNPVVGETNDGWLNDIAGRRLRVEEVFRALELAQSGPVEEGSVGAGTGTVCFGFKGGIGTSSRVLPKSRGGYTVGVLVQTNFDGILQINGAPVGRELGRFPMREELQPPEQGSCMIVVATDAPLLSRNLKRLAKRALFGLAHTGGYCSNGSGDYVIAFSTSPAVRIRPKPEGGLHQFRELPNSALSPLFLAVVEATEEAILNSLFRATPVRGKDGHQAEALPVEKIVEICRKYNVLNWTTELPVGRRP